MGWLIMVWRFPLSGRALSRMGAIVGVVLGLPYAISLAFHWWADTTQILAAAIATLASLQQALADPEAAAFLLTAFVFPVGVAACVLLAEYAGGVGGWALREMRRAVMQRARRALGSKE